ncbi:hypothetical protein [Peribacillus frigoritolerans]|uniref:hypothetical protein n=1 Tax=Peribacillus frigoritolerans TaxID=450367 RepID=UPI0025A20C32|nr:hypothetical protein [Peribacillus frigoritolerans]MDM5310351.1 hypothetical protein [Peribacillus frigoritolerans]
MKKNFLTEMNIDNSIYVYEDYELQGELFFVQNNMDAIFYEGGAPRKIIPLHKDMPIKDLLFKGVPYGENTNGQIERIDHENDHKKYKIKAAYLVAKKAITSLQKENQIKLLFPDKKVTTEYNLNSFGKTLYTELAKWDFSSFHEIINFCETWGIPTGVTLSDLQEKLPVNDINIIWMSLENFYTKIHEYHKFFSYFKALNTNDFSKLPTTPKKGEHIIVHARRMLDAEIEKKSLFSYKITRKEDIPTPISVFKDLFDAAYFYLTLSIYSQAEMRLCEYCGHLFEVTHQRQRFCSVLPGRKRSSCEMAYNNRLKKEKRLKQRGEK